MSDLSKKFNAFNGMKALVHTEYWQPIVTEKKVPPVRFLSVDPCGVCDYACPFCNAAETMNSIGGRMTGDTMDDIIQLVKDWKVRAVCVGGGGESLLNPNTSYLINKLADLGVNIGVVTNGTHIDKHVDALLRCKWVGISMDAGYKETYMKMKGISTDKWNKVIHNMKMLAGKNVELTWKFLLHPDNYQDVYEAVRVAKETGCNVIHIRPGSHPWFAAKDEKSFQFSEAVVKSTKEQIEKARKDFETEKFKVFAVADKFTDLWGVKKSFSKCYAIFTTLYIDAERNVGLCCDRRGDKNIILCKLQDIRTMWGSAKHWEIHNDIKVNLCPRCTYTHINEIFENVIEEDKMLFNMY